MPASPDDPPSPPTEAPRKASLAEVVTAVFWSFLGIRKGRAMQRDAVTIKPVQVIVVGLIFAALFVASLVLLVRFIIAHAG